ncbi:hypothetical protein COLO4_21225 [Corchorus olitorius]|uniref:Uncharacterized protein n=1 Tax=Corchorus olitorius TaxID=93759 RepID=A0A1R3IV18_9ROSI|nr:hypothetical protein COLO4_21225 [Corchorus olitorius]
MESSTIEFPELPIVIERNILGSKERRKGSILTKKAAIFGGIVVITGLKSQAGSHQALNAGSTKRRNQAPVFVAD